MTGLPTPLTEQGETISGVWDIFLIGAALVGTLILVLLAIILIRFRRRNDQLPEQVHYRLGLEVAYTVLPLLAVCGLLVLTLTSLAEIESNESDPDLIIEVTASQWQWQFYYPESEVTVRQPGDGEAPTLVLPQGAVVEFHLQSPDVIHSFWVPGFLTKRDIIPGRPATMQANISGAPGTFPGVCAEYCGLNHTSMRFDVQIVDAKDFDAWLAEQEGDNP